MRRQSIARVAAITIPIGVWSIAPALAGSPYQDGTQPGQRVRAASPQPDRSGAGLFTCSYREARTKLERKQCGGRHP